MRFVLWLSGKTLGVESQTQLANALGKSKTLLSGWLAGARPEWDNIRHIAETVGVNAAWLDNPAAKDAVEPADWPEWWASRARRKAGS